MLKDWKYTFDNGHGFGILFEAADDHRTCRTFFEDGTLLPSDWSSGRDSSISYMLNVADNRWYSPARGEAALLEKYLSDADICFSTGLQDSMDAELSLGKEQYKVRVFKDRYSYSNTCSCGKRSCVHLKAVCRRAKTLLQALQHTYVITEQQVDKSLFLDPCLMEAVLQLNERAPDQELIASLRRIIRMLDSADSGAYCELFHRFLLDLSPYVFDARFLEDSYSFLITVLCDDPGYRSAVLEKGGYADPEVYEERQHRSNRACLKRVIKYYVTAARELEKGNFREDIYKELLLKYRDDHAGLLRYYAQGKESIGLYDLPFLENIVSDPAADPAWIRGTAIKLDRMEGHQEAAAIFHRLADKLPPDQKLDLYSCLQTITIPMEEVRKLPAGDQLKLINSVPLTKENFFYVMDELLAPADNGAKGRFILHTLKRAGYGHSRDASLKQAVLSRIALLPDNRLLLGYAIYRLNMKGSFRTQKGDPELELGAYFSCDYEIINEKSRFHTVFTVCDPEDDLALLTAREEDGKLSDVICLLPRSDYPPELVRKVCLAGREAEYEDACARNQDVVDAFRFSQKEPKFTADYHRLLSSLGSEKLMLSGENKAGIDWFLYREDDSNALAFKVGTGKKYVVKDAQEFINAFKSGITTEYGKDLILTHDPGNLREDDAAVIRLLMAGKYKKGRRAEKTNKRYVTVSDSMFSSILEALAGRTVFYDDAPCVLRLEPGKVRLRVSGDFTLSTDLDPSRQEFWNLAGRGYLLDRRDGEGCAVIDRVPGTTEEIQVTDLVYRHPAVNVRPILKDFRKNIYSRFFEMFDIDKKVQPEFALSSLRLNTYFDFENSAVTARTEIFRDDREISAASLSDRIDAAKFELLQNYLSGLGFIDGKLTDEGRILAFFKLDFSRLKKLTNVYLSESLQNKELRSVGRPVIRVSYKNNMVQVFLEKSEYSETELSQIIDALRKKKKYILLSGDRIVDLDSEAARDLGEAVSDFGMDPKDLYRKKKISFITAIKAFSHEKSCRVDGYLKNMIGEIRGFKEADIPLPKLDAELRGYQEEGFRWMSVLCRYGMGGILADDMGLGKTIQVIALLKADSGRKPSLVVCPKSLVFNWISEFARFDGSTPVRAIYGPESRRSEIIASIDWHKKEIFITSYDSLRNDIEKYTGGFNYVILDEAQYIKNVNALKTRSVKELKAAHRFALTGTPIENSVVDLWSIFDFIMPGYFDDLKDFKDTDTSVIARKSAPFILRRVKEDVLEDLPPKYERILSAEMSDSQRKLYEAMRSEARRRLEEGGKAFDILPYLTRLRQICVDPAMFVESYDGGSGKLDLISSLIPQYLEEHHRILIFSQFVRALESVRKLLNNLGISTYFLSGSTSAKDRMEMMDAFNNGTGADVFLISLKAGGTGLNLTGADTVIHLDPWWNVAAENQASDRTHRIGQTRNVEVIRLIADDSIEQRVAELQDIKKEVIKQVISDSDGSVTSASLEDIAFVLD